MRYDFTGMPLANTKLDNNSDPWGRLAYAFCGGLCLAVLALFMVSLLGVEIRQSGYSAGKGIFFFIWSTTVLSAFFVKNRFLLARNIALLFTLFSFVIPILYFFQTDISVWSNSTVLWVNLTFVFLGGCALAIFLWLARICQSASSP